MQIVPMQDLQNTAEIERRCLESNEPIFVTKNGYDRLVVMDIDYYEQTMKKLDEAIQVNRGIADYKAGKVVDGKKSLKKMREKYGI